jgi:hypothetical protein
VNRPDLVTMPALTRPCTSSSGVALASRVPNGDLDVALSLYLRIGKCRTTLDEAAPNGLIILSTVDPRNAMPAL